MLAVRAKEFESLRYPLLASPKVDGIRAVNKDGALLSRTMTAIPNAYTQSAFGGVDLHGLDGELVVGSPNDANCMQTTMSGVMTRTGEPEVKWFIFDNWGVDKPYAYRAKYTKDFLQSLDRQDIIWLPQTMIKSVEQLYEYEDKIINLGFEGVILRAPDGPYKQNRSTVKEGYMLKLKRFLDSEAEILDAYELMHNNNEATIDARGFTKRSTHIANKEAAGVLGGFNVRDIHDGREFEVGTGFTMEQRKNLWEAWKKNPKYLTCKLIKYKHFPKGVVDKPRHPIFLGFRDRRDM